MNSNAIRLLRPDEIECRIASVSEKGVSLLLYKDARVDQRILDETFGVFGWKRSHQCIDGNLYCTVEIFDTEHGEWVSKQDVGTMGQSEKEKSQASDSFKRACFNWGIGRELYSAPFIWVAADRVSVQRKGEKLVCYDRFYVSDIGYDGNREISRLEISKEHSGVIYSFTKKTDQKEARKNEDCNRNDCALTDSQMKRLNEELKRTGIGMDTVKERYKFNEISDLNTSLYDKVMKALSKTKSANAA